MWGVTVQNEPEFAAPWEACKYNDTAERDFVQHFLGPTLKHAYPDLKIIAFDHNKDNLFDWTNTIFDRDHDASRYVDGMGFHWYAGGTDRRLDGTLGYNNLERTSKVLKAQESERNFDGKKILIGTEGCNCPGTATTSAQALFRAERIAHNLIADLNSFSNGWVDWNLILDEFGGPNHLGNVCDSPMTIDKADRSLVALQPMLFYMWHIQGFFRPGSKRLEWEWSPTEEETDTVAKVDYKSSGPSGAIPGMEATVATCEASTRQAWRFTPEGYLQVADSTSSHKDAGTCLGNANDGKLRSVLLVACDQEGAVGEFAYDAADGTLKAPRNESMCLGRIGDVQAEGAGVHVVPCDADDAAWKLEAQPGGVHYVTLKSDASQCLTAGWPFLSVAAFEVPPMTLTTVDGSEVEAGHASIVVTVLNEGERGAALDMLIDGGESVVSEIPPKSIQTYVLGA
mmetsp:Transcript_45189/g.141600  ORF Transcript_45189/g.141600 Transcript_45189/m.141600 type:complete len:455 (-) Transcript_45189:222-1586(-)